MCVCVCVVGLYTEMNEPYDRVFFCQVHFCILCSCSILFDFGILIRLHVDVGWDFSGVEFEDRNVWGAKCAIYVILYTVYISF